MCDKPFPDHHRVATQAELDGDSVCLALHWPAFAAALPLPEFGASACPLSLALNMLLHALAPACEMTTTQLILEAIGATTILADNEKHMLAEELLGHSLPYEMCTCTWFSSQWSTRVREGVSTNVLFSVLGAVLWFLDCSFPCDIICYFGSFAPAVGLLLLFSLLSLPTCTHLPCRAQELHDHW